MTNLVLANVNRLVKNRAFRIANLITVLLALFQIIMIYQDYKKGLGSPYFDSGLFSFSALGIFALAAVVSLFVGAEFGDGTIRNKLVIGHTRSRIYLSLLITSVIAGLLLAVSWSVGYLIPGLLLLEAANPLSFYLLLYAGMFIEFSVFCAVFILITMAAANKSAAAVACLLIGLTLLMQAIVVKSILDEPKFYTPGIVIGDDGNYSQEGEPEANPNYLPEGSSGRQFYEFLMDFTPGGQALLVAGHQIHDFSRMCLYDAGWIIVLSGIGILSFKHKDLK